MSSQVFKFCCRCQRVALIKKDSCFFCESRFLLHGAKTDNYNEYMKNYYKLKLKQ